MKLAYYYKAKGALGEVDGVIYAERAAFARSTLKKMGLQPKVVRFAPLRTLFGSFDKGFELAELEQFYRYFSRLEEKGAPRASSIADAINTTSDMRLKASLAVMSEAIGGSGMSVSEAMQAAGFPDRDCHLIRNVEKNVPIYSVLRNLADELRRVQDIKRTIGKLLLMPKLLGGVGAILFYVTVMYVSPRVYRLFSEVLTNVELPDFVLSYYKACEWASQNFLISTLAYVGAVLGVIVLLRSDFIRAALELLKPVRYARLKADYAALWGSFSLLISAGVHLEEICNGLAKAAATREARLSFSRMAKYVREGREVDDAAAAARFPLYIVNPVSSAQRSGSLAEGTRDLSAKLIVDLEDFTGKASTLIQVGTLFLMAGFVMLFASVTVLPMLSAMFSAI